MKLSHIAFACAASIAGVLFWPVTKNYVATAEVRHVPLYKAKLTRILPYTGASKNVPGEIDFGTVQLSPAQRERLLGLLDWDYIIFGQSLRGIPGGFIKERLEFTPASGPQDVVISVEPHLAYVTFSGKVRASNFSGKNWELFRDELFPEAHKYDFFGRKVHN